MFAKTSPFEATKSGRSISGLETSQRQLSDHNRISTPNGSRESFDAILRPAISRETAASHMTPRRILQPSSTTNRFLYSISNDCNEHTILMEPHTNLNRRSTNFNPRSSIGTEGIFGKTTQDETPLGRLKRARINDSTREEIENQLQHEDSKVTSAGRWILSQLSKIPLLGPLVLLSRSPSETPTSDRSGHVLPQKNPNSVPSIQSDYDLSQETAGRGIDASTGRSSPNSESNIYTPDRQRLQLESGLIKDETEMFRPMTQQERQVVADLPVYNSPEEELADLEYIMKVRRACKCN